MTQNKNDEINSILQPAWSCFDKNCGVASPYLTLCPRQCKWKVDTTYLATRTKNSENI